MLGLLLYVVVHSADIQDRQAAQGVLCHALAACPTLKLFWADGDYAGKLVQWIAATLGRVLEIIKRSRNLLKIVQWRWFVAQIIRMPISHHYEFVITSQICIYPVAWKS